MADGEQAATSATKSKNADLPVRLASALVMVGVASFLLWLGGWFWVAFVALLAGLVLWEWNKLVKAFAGSPLIEVLWLFFGALYVGGAALAMVEVRQSYVPFFMLVGFILPIIAVDVGAYFAGRAVGGPKILPSVSPSKTWAGLGGGILAACIVTLGVQLLYPEAQHFGSIPTEGFDITSVIGPIVIGTVIAVLAQAGDFFESWMKRKAGVKDSGTLIPGHGGLFDRLDGFLAVFFVLAITRIFLG